VDVDEVQSATVLSNGVEELLHVGRLLVGSDVDGVQFVHIERHQRG
jgi:hypothetical protein